MPDAWWIGIHHVLNYLFVPADTNNGKGCLCVCRTMLSRLIRMVEREGAGEEYRDLLDSARRLPGAASLLEVEAVLLPAGGGGVDDAAYDACFGLVDRLLASWDAHLRKSKKARR